VKKLWGSRKLDFEQLGRHTNDQERPTLPPSQLQAAISFREEQSLKRRKRLEYENDGVHEEASIVRPLDLLLEAIEIENGVMNVMWQQRLPLTQLPLMVTRIKVYACEVAEESL
jgi:hypothetical protein